MPKKNDSKYDKLYKIRPMLEALKINFNKNYHAPEKVAIDR